MFQLDESQPRGRKGRSKKKSGAQDTGWDKASSNRVRKTPDILAFYKFLKQHCLRDEAYKTLLMDRLGEEGARQLRRKLTSRPVAAPVVANA